MLYLVHEVTWCFTPSQPLRLYQGDNELTGELVMGEEHGMNCAVFFFTNQTKRIALGDVSSPGDTRRAHSCANRHPSETRNKRCRFGEKIPFRISNCRPLPVVKSLHEDI